MLNKILCCGYEGDGHTKYKCLKCYETWHTSTSYFKYCPFCGIQFESIQENKKIERLEKIYQFERNKLFQLPKQKPYFVLVIETRFYYGTNNQYVTNWKIDKCFALIDRFNNCKSKDIKRWLYDYKEDKIEDKTEYKYYMEKYNEYKHGYVYCW